MARISTNRKSGFIRRGGVMRRESLWLEIGPTDTNLAAASTAALFTGFSAALLALRPFTIVRVRGYWHIATDQEAVDELQQCAIGFAVVSDQALAIGVTAVPTAFTDIGSDLWFLHQILTSRYQFISNTGSPGVISTGQDLDSKAMRKVEEGQDVALTVETSSASAGLLVSKAGRMLVKLH